MNKLKLYLFLSAVCIAIPQTNAQEISLTNPVTTSNREVMTPELLWKLGRVSALGISKDKKHIVYKVTTPSVQNNNFSSKYFIIPIEGGNATEIKEADSYLNNKNISPDGKYLLYTMDIMLQPVLGTDLYDYPFSNVKIYNSLDYRHWSSWFDGKYSHVFFKEVGQPDTYGIDLLEDKRYYCPQKPFGGDNDYIWSPDSKKILYVTKKSEGTAYALSTNTDIYQYDIATKSTTNLTSGMKGYDTEPAFNKKGALAWLSMERDGYEADKNDIYVLENGIKQNLTKQWDGTVSQFIWADDDKTLFFTAPIGGTIQLFSVDYPGKTKKMPLVTQLSDGQFDVTGIIGQIGNKLYVTRTDMNTAAEIYSFDLKTKQFQKLTSVNDAAYNNISRGEIKKRIVKTTDNKDMVVWVIYPPDFDPNKKYPTLLYCQGGPQSEVSQFYSFRWNFQLMAAQGYIVVAPNRRGLPGFGVEWNEAISKDWGGQAMKDYLSAIDDVSKESYVDKDRRGAVGASYGGYSVFYLAGIHQGRFKTLISHAGVFDTKSMYGTTEEVWFPNFDAGGAYWETGNKDAQKAYNEFNPSNFVQNWNTPILIIQGGLDFRVPIGQGQEAFQAAQLRGIKSRFVYFPEENHWILSPQNGMIWQSEFFKWLQETL
ncbi:MAG: S9 family peptidase [Bacteroidetes bacterium]|nr:S9 family peptidase [Bacteroidota bacterium]